MGLVAIPDCTMLAAMSRQASYGSRSFRPNSCSVALQS